MNDPEDPGGNSLVQIADEQDEAVDLPSLEFIALRALEHLDMNGELSIALVTPEHIQQLKSTYYGIDAPTDVLSFPLDPPLIGEIVVCPAFAAVQARALGRTLDDEMRQLVVHGVLHLSGLDHSARSDEIAMALHERMILERA